MKVITSIYLKCRPDLRDEWLTGAEVDDAQDALVSLSCDPTLPLLFHVASVFIVTRTGFTQACQIL